LDVHPPHEPIHSWRDFFIHLITITIGLLIALSLEGLVEWNHHRHLKHEAHATIRQEIQDNRKTSAQNLQWIQEDERRVEKDIQTLRSLRAGKKLTGGSLEYHLSWSSPSAAAWQTAHSTGALNYFDYADAQSLADVYLQQDFVVNSGMQLYKNQTEAIAPLFISGDPNTMSKEEIQLCLTRSADVLLGLRALEQVIVELNREYDDQLKRM
jgi:hypothetical protein